VVIVVLACPFLVHGDVLWRRVGMSDKGTGMIFGAFQTVKLV